MTGRTAVSVTILAAATVALGQTPPAAPREDDRRAQLLQNIGRVFQSLSSLGDWDQHYPLLMDAVEKVYQRNGWDREPDQFSLAVIREVNAIPPWSPLERFNRLVGMVSDRYLLDERQEWLLRATFIREANELFMEHSGRIVQYAVEAIQTRAAGDAFTPEQVARWVQLAEPVFQDARQRIATSAGQLMDELDADQRAVVQADLAALNRRLDDVQNLSQRWARGEWQASDWGLESDPIQLAGQARSAQHPGAQAEAGGPDAPTPGADARRAAADAQPASAAPAMPLPPTPPRPASPAGGGAAPWLVTAAAQTVGPAAPDEPWAQYVRRFIEKYRLNEAQQARAWKIYHDVRTRRERYHAVFAERIEAARQRAASPAGAEHGPAAMDALEAEQRAALNRLFEQLKRRLDTLPTRAQRREAQPIALEPATQPAPGQAGSP